MLRARVHPARMMDTRAEAGRGIRAAPSIHWHWVRINRSMLVVSFAAVRNLKAGLGLVPKSQDPSGGPIALHTWWCDAVSSYCLHKLCNILPDGEYESLYSHGLRVLHNIPPSSYGFQGGNVALLVPGALGPSPFLTLESRATPPKTGVLAPTRLR